jgi:hypothetical protein
MNKESLMTNAQRAVLLLLTLVTAIAMEGASTPSTGVTVDCSKGQSLNQTLAKLNKTTPTTVSVSGTCTEYVQVVGFQGLTLEGLTGATLVQPSTSGGSLFNAVLYIESSNSVIVNGLNVTAGTTVAGIGIGHGSSDIRLRYLTVTGGSDGIVVFENSQASIAFVQAQAPGYATLAIYDSSDVHVEHSQFTAASGAGWNLGIALGASHVTLYSTIISNMQVGIGAYQTSIVDLVTFNTYYSTGGSTDVTIENSAGTSNYGVQVDGGGSLNVASARLVINKPGQTLGSTTGGVVLSDGASMSASDGDLVITASNGQGVVAMDNAHATLTGATITGGGHAGLVAVNLSSIDISAGTTLSTIGGNAVDLFCDSNSWVTGSSNISGVPKAQCTNLLASETVALP